MYVGIRYTWLDALAITTLVEGRSGSSLGSVLVEDGQHMIVLQKDFQWLSDSLILVEEVQNQLRAAVNERFGPHFLQHVGGKENVWVGLSREGPFVSVAEFHCKHERSFRAREEEVRIMFELLAKHHENNNALREELLGSILK